MNQFKPLLEALDAAGVSFVIIGGVAATIHGSARLTTDLDIVYDRSPGNLQRLVAALKPLEPYLRGAPPSLPFTFDAETLRKGLNFTLTTTAGPIDLLGEVSGVGDFGAVNAVSEDVLVFGLNCRCINVDALIRAKKAAGRTKDFEAIAELEIIRDDTRDEDA